MYCALVLKNKLLKSNLQMQYSILYSLQKGFHHYSNECISPTSIHDMYDKQHCARTEYKHLYD